MPEELQAVPELPRIKVSRRDRRALERLSGPKAPSSRVLFAAVAALVFAVGFLLGRLGSVEQEGGPSVRALPAAHALTPFDVEGSAVYLLWSDEPLATIAVHNLFSGDVLPRARLSPPFENLEDAETQVAALGGSVAVAVADSGRSFVAFAPSDGPAHGWVPGVEAAWASPDELWVREADGTVVEWSVGLDGMRAHRSGRAERIFQTPHGAVVQRAGSLISPRRRLELPDQVEVIATDGERALLDGDALVLWDGRSTTKVRVQGFRALAATFDHSADRAAMVLRHRDDLTLAIVDARGNAALKPLGARSGACVPAVSWDRGGSWVYVAPGDGALYAVEANGGHVERVRTHGVGCGLAWIS
jgi:hypothetical protein